MSLQRFTGVGKKGVIVPDFLAVAEKNGQLAGKSVYIIENKTVSASDRVVGTGDFCGLRVENNSIIEFKVMRFYASDPNDVELIANFNGVELYRSGVNPSPQSAPVLYGKGSIGTSNLELAISLFGGTREAHRLTFVVIDEADFVSTPESYGSVVTQIY